MKKYWWWFALAIVVALNSDKLDALLKGWIPDGKKRAQVLFGLGLLIVTITGIYIGRAVSVIGPVWTAVAVGLIPIGTYLLSFLGAALWARRKG